MTSNFFVFTGGPGSGKSSLIHALAERGFSTAPEAGRAIIQAQQSIGGEALPWHNRQLFAELMLSWDMRSHDSAGGGSTILFDRGVPDNIGYLQLCGLEVPAHMWRAAEQYRYNRQIFILPPFFLGNLIGDGLLLLSGKATIRSLGDLFKGSWSLKGISTMAFGLLVVLALLFVDWRTLLQKKKVKWKWAFSLAVTLMLSSL